MKLFFLLACFLIPFYGCATVPRISITQSQELAKAFRNGQVKMLVSPCIYYDSLGQNSLYIMRDPSIAMGKLLSQKIEAALKEKALSISNGGLPVLCAVSLHEDSLTVPIAKDQGQPVIRQAKPIGVYKGQSESKVKALYDVLAYDKSYYYDDITRSVVAKKATDEAKSSSDKYILVVRSKGKSQSLGSSLYSAFTGILAGLAGGSGTSDMVKSGHVVGDIFSLEYGIIDVRTQSLVLYATENYDDFSLKGSDWLNPLLTELKKLKVI